MSTDHPHGEIRRYYSGCRCPDCRRANAQYQAEYRQRLKIGAVQRRPRGGFGKFVALRMEAALVEALDAAAAAAGTSRSATIRAALKEVLALDPQSSARPGTGSDI